jgi:hypothetical protein
MPRLGTESPARGRVGTSMILNWSGPDRKVKRWSKKDIYLTGKT